jgi:hypothetical protein
MVPMIVEALRGVTHPRFFDSERGFQAEFLANLRVALPNAGLLGDAIVEQEYQKRLKVHGIRRRPDIIIHVPTPPGGSRRQSNFVAFALKLAAGTAKARRDLEALDAILRALDYPFGVFVNIASQKTHADQYRGLFPDRIHCFAVWRNAGQVRVRHAYYRGTRLMEEV